MLRLQLLIAQGGIYLDLDVVVVRPLAPLLRAGDAFVIGREGDDRLAFGAKFHGLCNAVMLARPNATFARRWLAEYASFGDTSTARNRPWAADAKSGHSVALPAALAAAHPRRGARVERHTAFFWPDWDEEPLRALLLYRDESHFRHRPFAFHLWGSLGAPFVLSSWSPEYLTSVPSALNCRLQRAEAPLPPRAGGRHRRWGHAAQLLVCRGRAGVAAAADGDAAPPPGGALRRSWRRAAAPSDCWSTRAAAACTAGSTGMRGARR